MKIRGADFRSLIPERLVHAKFPTQILFWLQPKIVPEDLILAARRTEAGCHARMHHRIGGRNLVTSGKTISPDAAELVEVIVAAASHQIQSGIGRRTRFQKSRLFLDEIANEGRLRSEKLRHKRPLLAGIDLAVEKPGSEREPFRWAKNVLIINRQAGEEGASR